MENGRLSKSSLVSWAVSIVLLAITAVAGTAVKELKDQVKTDMTVNNVQTTEMAVMKDQLADLRGNYAELKEDNRDMKIQLRDIHDAIIKIKVYRPSRRESLNQRILNGE